MLSDFSIDIIEKNQQQVINNSVTLERQLNKITGQIFSNKKIYDSLIYSDILTNETRKIFKDEISTFLFSSDVTSLYFWNAKTGQFFSNVLVEIDKEDIAENIGNLEKILEDARNGKRFFKTQLNESTGYISKSSSEFWVIYLLNRDALLANSVLNYDGCNTAIYYKNKIFIASDYSMFQEELKNEPSVETGYKKRGNDLVHTYKMNAYTSVSILPDNFIKVWYSDTLKSIWIFAIVLLIISILMIVLFGFYYHNAAQSYLSALSSKSNQSLYSDIKALLTRCMHNKTIMQEDNTILNNFISETEFTNIHCVIIQLDYLNRLLLNNSYNEITSYMKQLKLICENCFSKYGTCIISDFDVDTVGMLLLETEKISEEKFLRLISEMKTELANYLSISVTVTVSNGFFECDEIIYTLLKLDNLKNYRYMLGYNSVISEKNDYNKDEDIIYPENLNKEISSAILSDNREKYTELLDEFKSEI